MTARSNVAIMLTTVAFILLATDPLSAATDPTVKCETGKVKSAGKYAACRLKTEAKARKKGVVADMSKCDAKLTKKWNKAEAKADGACPVTGDLEANRSTITSQTQSIIDDLFPNGLGASSAITNSRALDPGIACAFTKTKQASKYELCWTKIMAQARLKDVKADYSKCDATLVTKWTTVESKGGCATTGDATTVEVKLTAQVTEFALAVSAAQCANGVLESGEQCEPGDPLSACADELCAQDCTCWGCCAALRGDPFNPGTYTPDLCGIAPISFCQDLVQAWDGDPNLNYAQGAAGAMCSPATGTCEPPPTPIGNCWQVAYDPLCSAGPDAPTPTACSPPNVCPGDIIVFSDTTCTATGCEACLDGGCDPSSECGDTPCGESCGTCSADQVCVPTVTPFEGTCCTPACSGKDCGTDGCGGSCGTCTGSEVCVSGTCTCTPDCAGKNCGSDGCGGSCGRCTSPDVCFNGVCTCFGSCTGKECGDDGCGGSCGTCDSGYVCSPIYHVCVVS